MRLSPGWSRSSGTLSREVTGRESTSSEAVRWKEVAELLVTELKVAASRTTVTSAPAFLAEHLRRRLRKADARQIEREVGEASTKQAAGASKPELTAEQIQEQVNLMAARMRDGVEMRELEEQFATQLPPRPMAHDPEHSPRAGEHPGRKTYGFGGVRLHPNARETTPLRFR